VFSDGASVNGAGKQHGQLLRGVIGYAEIRFYTTNTKSMVRKMTNQKTNNIIRSNKKGSFVFITHISTQNQQLRAVAAHYRMKRFSSMVSVSTRA
jgi:hypothetical protein